MIAALTVALFTSSLAFSGSYKKDIVDTAVGAGSFNTLVAAVQAADLVDTLKSEGPFTVLRQPMTHLPSYQRERLRTC